MFVRFRTAKIFNALRRASPDVDYPARRKRGGPKLDILLRRRRLRDRTPARRESSWVEILCAAAFAAAALGFLVRGYAGSASGITPTLPVPFACAALLGIWTSRLPYARKILWSVPAVAFMVPFLPAP